MAEISWIKLKTTMFDDEKIRLIQAVPESDAILVIWIRLLVLAGKTNDDGLIYIQRNMPYTEEMLSTLFDKPVNTVRLALSTLGSFNMIDLNTDGMIAITNWEKHQNVEGMDKIRLRNAERNREYRKKKKQLSLETDSDVTRDITVTSRDATDIDKELDKEQEQDKEKKNVYIDQFESFWGKYPKRTQKKKALEQFKKKINNESELFQFQKGFNDYLKYIILNEWYTPQEFFRWIRDERYKDEYDLTERSSNYTFNSNHRVEELPSHISSSKKQVDDIDILSEADRIIEERQQNE